MRSAANVEVFEADRSACLMLFDKQAGNKEPGEDKEDLHAGCTAQDRRGVVAQDPVTFGNRVDAKMGQDHKDHGECAKPVKSMDLGHAKTPRLRPVLAEFLG